MVREHGPAYRSEWATMCSIAEKLGGKTEIVRPWVRRAQRDDSGGDDEIVADALGPMPIRYARAAQQMRDLEGR